MKTYAACSLLLEFFCYFVDHFSVTVCFFAKEENPSSIKGLIYHCFVKPLLHRVRIVICLKDNEVAEQKRVDRLLVPIGLVNLRELLWTLQETRETLVN